MGVDAKLVEMARDIGAAIVTTDYNLNKVAQIRGVEVLNVNELANALKPAVLPGEPLTVKVIREGREYDQGVGYLADGTMIVVEGGRASLGEVIEVEVTSVLQSPSGKMIFTRLAGAAGAESGTAAPTLAGVRPGLSRAALDPLGFAGPKLRWCGRSSSAAARWGRTSPAR